MIARRSSTPAAAAPLLALAIVALSACATAGGEASGDAGAGSPAATGPFLFQGPFFPAAPNPEIRLPWQTAQVLGVMTPAFATPGDVDKLEAMCRESSRPEPCLRSLRVCREKSCRLVPAGP